MEAQEPMRWGDLCLPCQKAIIFSAGPVGPGLLRPQETPKSGLFYEHFSLLHVCDCVKLMPKPD